MISKDFVVLMAVCFVMFTVFKVESDEAISRCKNEVVIKSTERPPLYEIYD